MADYTTKDISRFWNKVNKNGPVNKWTGDECWVWHAQVDRCGYGVIRIGRKNISSHRMSMAIEYGGVPPGAHVCHHCDIPNCVRPSHLYFGDASSNMRDAVKRGRLVNPCGEDHVNSKLTSLEVLAIRKESSEGTTNRELSIRYGMSTGQISNIITRKQWRHV